ncbi:hypothetical protein RD055328_03930 [Companilactobacillus sp. RD055328]|uniref:hypothetical protein n=1 Tax=Companilactobacillus sp. RD055328 TaxID=2916634 RepID=UPI001FC80F25|nr:hypothetical protein [Companilactobacillus sp. RD055328]GKQ42470.1 hypothetical protein RD055328_03930 [Companilactobacillus sp. RD055328]
MKNLKINKKRPLSLRLIDTIIDIASIILFPFIFASRFSITPMKGYIYVIIFIALIYVYKDIFIPKNPNKYFDILFLTIFLILSVIFSFKLNSLITTISIFQLLLFIVAKYVKKSTPLLTDLIFNFLTPTFLMIILTYSLTKFISYPIIILILLINTFSLTTNYIEVNYKSLFGLLAVITLVVLIVLAEYISVMQAISMASTLLVFILIKYFFNISLKSCWARLFLSLMQLF